MEKATVTMEDSVRGGTKIVRFFPLCSFLLWMGWAWLTMCID